MKQATHQNQERQRAIRKCFQQTDKRAKHTDSAAAKARQDIAKTATTSNSRVIC
jgi:hypothetical protein